MPLNLEIPLPAFRRPVGADDPPLPPESPDSPGPDSPGTMDASLTDRPPLPDQDSAPPGPPPILEPPATAGRTATWATRARARVSSADAEHAGKVVAGLLATGLRALGWQMRRVNRELRQPRGDQLRAIAEPAGRILARFVPAEFLSGLLVDVAELGAAANAYVLDDPGDGAALVTRIPTATYAETE